MTIHTSSLQWRKTKRGSRWARPSHHPACLRAGYVSAMRSVRQRVQRALEPVGVRALGLCERLEPVRNLAEAFVARRLGHTGIHVGVFMRLAGDRGLQILARASDREIGRRIPAGLHVLEVPMSMSRFAFR